MSHLLARVCLFVFTHPLDSNSVLLCVSKLCCIFCMLIFLPDCLFVSSWVSCYFVLLRPQNVIPYPYFTKVLALFCVFIISPYPFLLVRFIWLPASILINMYCCVYIVPIIAFHWSMIEVIAFHWSTLQLWIMMNEWTYE